MTRRRYITESTASSATVFYTVTCSSRRHQLDASSLVSLGPRTRARQYFFGTVTLPRWSSEEACVRPITRNRDGDMAHLERDVAEVEQRRQRDKQRAPLGRVDAEHVPRVTGRRDAFRLSFLPAAPRDDYWTPRSRWSGGGTKKGKQKKSTRTRASRARSRRTTPRRRRRRAAQGSRRPSGTRSRPRLEREMTCHVVSRKYMVP